MLASVDDGERVFTEDTAASVREGVEASCVVQGETGSDAGAFGSLHLGRLLQGYQSALTLPEIEAALSDIRDVFLYMRMVRRGCSASSSPMRGTTRDQIVAQLQLAFLRLDNVLVDRCKDVASGDRRRRGLRLVAAPSALDLPLVRGERLPAHGLRHGGGGRGAGQGRAALSQLQRALAAVVSG